MLTNMMGTILAIGSVLGALLTIEKFGVKFSPLYKVKKWLMRGVYDRFDDFANRLDKLEDQQLKLLICNDKLPLKERVDYGREYLSRGLNGEIRIKVGLLEKRLEAELQQKLEREFRE